MVLETIAEFRGKETKLGKENHVFRYVNLEDNTEAGGSAKFQCDVFESFDKLKKGDKVRVLLDYNTKYSSLKVININVIK